jgi:hypothetical protein
MKQKIAHASAHEKRLVAVCAQSSTDILGQGARIAG